MDRVAGIFPTNDDIAINLVLWMAAFIADFRRSLGPNVRIPYTVPNILRLRYAVHYKMYCICLTIARNFILQILRPDLRMSLNFLTNEIFATRVFYLSWKIYRKLYV